MIPNENTPAATEATNGGDPHRARTSPQETHAFAGYPDIPVVTTMDLPPVVGVVWDMSGERLHALERMHADPDPLLVAE